MIYAYYLQANNEALENAASIDDLTNGEGEDKTATPLRKGLLWQQRDKLFSQWKERYFILTPDYLQCFKKGSSKITEIMGEFIFKVRSKLSMPEIETFWPICICKVVTSSAD